MSRRTRCARTIVLAASALALAASPGIASASESSSTPSGYSDYYKGRVVSPIPLKVRDKASTEGHVLATLDPASTVEIICKKKGQRVGGHHYWGGNPYWYLIEELSQGSHANHYVAAYYVENTGPAPRACTASDTSAKASTESR